MPPTDSLQADADALQHVMLQASQLARRNLMDILSTFNLTVPQYMALGVIRRTEGGCTMSALAEATHQVSATMTGIIDRLGERGLVERREDSADRRSRRVYLTESGANLLTAIDEQRQAHMLDILGHFSPEERQNLIRLMEQYLLVLQTLNITQPTTL